MTLKDVATVSGKGGLFKVLAPTKSGVILESLDEAKTKMIATTNNRLSLLDEISIYTTTREGTVGLDEVLKKIHRDFGDDPGIDSNADPAELRSFLKSVLPDYDENRVYVSDIKKLVRWYAVIVKYAPELLTVQSDDKHEGEDEKEPEKPATKEQKKEPRKAGSSASEDDKKSVKKKKK